MMKKMSLLIAMLFVGMVATTSQAFAFSLLMDGQEYMGPIQFKYNNWDYGTLYQPGTTFDHEGRGSGQVDSWGIFQVTEIQGVNQYGAWQEVWRPTSTEALEGWFYGLSDDKVNLSATGQGTIYSVGGVIEMYLSPARDLNPTAGPQVPFGGLGWTPADLYNATNGSLFLRADFVPGVVLGDGTTTYAQQVNSITQPVSGAGDAYLNLTGGAYQAMFDSNGFLGGNADLLLSSNFQGPGSYGWTANSFDPVAGAAVPEPASMTLLGLGLAGLVRFRRKR